MPLTKVKLQRFTAFDDLEVEFSPGINALIGANGTGKTHLMKAATRPASSTSRTGLWQTRLLECFCLPDGLAVD